MFKNTLSITIPRSVVILIVALAFLFDPSNLGIGIAAFPDTPIFILKFSEFLGNIVWLMSGFFLIMTVFVLFVFTDDAHKREFKKYLKEQFEKDNSLTAATMKTANGTFFLKKLSLWAKIRNALMIFLYIIGVGSGFWFSGACLLIVNLAILQGKTVLTKFIDNTFDEFRKDLSDEKPEVLRKLKED